MKRLQETILSLSLVLGTALISTQMLQAHCQVPCGIYDDEARVHEMLEDAKTVAKAAKLINELADKKDAQSQNQITRWIINKEKHAENIIQTISDYFLTQRVKVSQKDYTECLVKHHTVIVNAMKAKQNVDSKFMDALEKSIKDLAPYYSPKKLTH